MKKLLSMLGAIGLVATSSATVVACGESHNSVIDLSNTPMIGTRLTIYDKDNQPSIPQDILNAFNVENDLNLTMKDVKVDEIGPIIAPRFHATITAIDNKVVKGAINVSYVKKIVDLSTITGDNTKLKVYGDTKVRPAEGDILAAFNKLNNLKLELHNDVDVIALQNTEGANFTATINASNVSKYVIDSTKTDITITVNNTIDLTQSDKVWLYMIGNQNVVPSAQDILTAFNVANNQTFELSTEVTVEDIELIEDTGAYSATIKAAANSKAASNEIEVTIAVDQVKPLDLASKDIKNGWDFGGTILVNEEMILDAFDKINGINLTTKDVTIKIRSGQPSALITGKPTSTLVISGSWVLMWYVGPTR